MDPESDQDWQSEGECKPQFPCPSRPAVHSLRCFLVDTMGVDLDDDIEYFESGLLGLPQSHTMHILLVQNLAQMRFERYKRSQQKEDLDKSILYCVKAILLSPLSPTQPPFRNVTHILFGLTRSLFARSRDFDRPEEVKDCIRYLRHLRTLPLESCDPRREDVTASLIVILSTPVKSDGGGVSVTGNIEDIIVLFRELITSGISITIAEPVLSVLRRGGLSNPALSKVIECLQDVDLDQLTPDWRFVVRYLLAFALFARFRQNHSNGDHKNAAALLDTILDPNQRGNCPDWIRDQASYTAMHLSLDASHIFPNPEYLEATIPHLRAYVNSSSAGGEGRLLSINNLVFAAQSRFSHYSLADSREEANFYKSQLIGRQNCPSQDEHGELDPVQETMAIQQSIQHLEEQLSNTPPGTRHFDLLEKLLLSHQVKISLTNDPLDIEQSIEYGRLLLNTSEQEVALIFLPVDLFRTFEHTNNIKYLDEAISLTYDLLKLELDHTQDSHSFVFESLVEYLIRRWLLLRRNEDLDEIFRSMQLVANHQNASASIRLKHSCQWAYIARSSGHLSTLAAYKNAMSLIQKSLSFSPTVSIQHTRLVAMDKYSQVMPLNYASFLIGLGQFEEAVEILEQGRTQLWSEMRGFRTQTSQLPEEDAAMAYRFAKINEELEALTTSITPSARPEMEDSVNGSKDWTDPFGRLVIKQQRMVEERDALISQIRERPGLERFVTTPSFTTLRTAASRGPVIIIIHCEFRSEILIVFHKSLPCSIPTASGFYDRAIKLRDGLVEARKPPHGLNSYKYQVALSDALKV